MEEPLMTAAAAPAKRGRRVLIVDDNADSAQMMKVLLKYEGHEARVVHGGLEAFETAKSYRPDVILLDEPIPV